MTIVGTSGNDDLDGTAGDDEFDLTQGGNDTARGLGGNDSFLMGDTFTADDRIRGGDGIDTVFLSGDYSAGLVFKPTTFIKVEALTLGQGFDYTLDATHLVQDGNYLLFVDGSTLGTDNTLTFTAAGLTAGHFVLRGGAGADTMTGGTAYDSFYGNGGDDRMKGGGGPDTYYYALVSDSTGKKYDTIVGFDANENFIYPSLPSDEGNQHVTAVGHHVTHGALSLATFNADLEAAIGQTQLGKAHAVLFTPDGGGLTGELFLIVDANGQAGYQANKDLVIHFENAKHMGAFDLDNFSTAG